MGGKNSREGKAALGDHEKQVKEDAAKAAGKVNGLVNGVAKLVVSEDHSAACKCSPCNCNPCKCKEETATNEADKPEEAVKTEESDHKKCSDKCKCNPCSCQDCKCDDEAESKPEQSANSETAPPSEVAESTEAQSNPDQAQTEPSVDEANKQAEQDNQQSTQHENQEKLAEHQDEGEVKPESEQQQSDQQQSDQQQTNDENQDKPTESTVEVHDHQVQEHHQ